MHFESSVLRDDRAWLLGSNCRLNRDVRLKWITRVDDSFHARFSAIARSYRYIILNSPVTSALFHDRVSWQYQALDHEKMHKAAQVLLGEHDFSSFRAAGCQSKSASRHVQAIEVSRSGDLVYLDVKANAFLYHMVRNIAGSLMAVGRGERSCEGFEELFRRKNRKLADATASGSGLYFMRAFYPEQYLLPIAGKKPVLF